MSNIGFVGLGKLGLPCALAVESKGHRVWGYDINPAVGEILSTKHLPYREIWAQKHLEESDITFTSLAEVVENSESFLYRFKRHTMLVLRERVESPKSEWILIIPSLNLVLRIWLKR